MTPNSNILVLSAGRRVSLLKGFQENLKARDSRVFAADMKPVLSAACQIADKVFKLPHTQHSDYISILKDICLDCNIKLIIPTIDIELEILSFHKEKFSKLGIIILVSNIDLIKKFNDKRFTNDFFMESGLPTPKIYNKNQIEYPCLVKPYDGSLSKGVHLIKKESELTPEILENSKNIYCQYIDHEMHSEFTVDLYYRQDNKLLCVVPRKRLEVRGGEVSKGLTEKNEIVELMFDKLGYLSGAVGCLTLQLFRNDKTHDIWCIEINPRFGGGYPLTRFAGADFQEWLIQEYIEDTKPNVFHDWKDKTLMLRFDKEVIVYDHETL